MFPLLGRIPVWGAVETGRKGVRVFVCVLGGAGCCLLTQQLNKLFYLESDDHNQTGLKGEVETHEGVLVSPPFHLGKKKKPASP